MKRIVLSFVFCYSAFFCPFAMADEFMPFELESDESLVGTIQSLGRNSIDIYDEHEKAIKRLVCLTDPSQYHPGDRVRIYYDPSRKVVRTIKKMTALDYERKRQNLGYIRKADHDE